MIAFIAALLLFGRRRPSGGDANASARTMPVDFSSQYSPLAHRVREARNPNAGTLRTPWGMLVHTTGSGVTKRAAEQKRRPIDVALSTYIAMQNGPFWGGPSYVVDYDGTIYQLAPDNIVTAHAGPGQTGSADAYHNGTWGERVSSLTRTLWRASWLLFRHPYSLFPSSSPNTDYVGVEMVPVGNGFGGAPMDKGLRFTRAQHDAVARLARDLGARHGWPAQWELTSRLVGHEDVDPINRSDDGGGWDPGWLRREPYFDFAYVRKQVHS